MENLELLGTRVVNRRREEEDEYIGRGGNLGMGNPFTHIPLGATKAKFQASCRQQSIDKFEDWVFDQAEILANIDQLRGKRLGCYCHPLPCHGTVYVLLVGTYVWMRESFGIEPKFQNKNGRDEIRTYYESLKQMIQQGTALPECLRKAA